MATPRWAPAFVAALVAADQIVKHMMLALVFEPPTIVEVAPFFNLVPVWNRGISFGILGASELSRWLLVAVSLLIVALLVVWLVRAGRGIAVPALVLVIGGALSNVIDRVAYGAVVDFIDLHAFGWHWPTFNLADAAIVGGTALLLYDGLSGSPRALE